MTNKNESNQWQESCINEFLHNLYSLPDNERYQLKRAFGKNLSKCGTREQLILHLILPDGYFSDLQKEIFFFIACMEGYYTKEDNNRMKPEEIFSEFYHDETTSEKRKEKLITLISRKMTLNGTFFYQLCVFVKSVKKKGFCFDAFHLTKDLLNWNYPSNKRESFVQSKYICAIANYKKKGNKK